jgi:hypothetical protein
MDGDRVTDLSAGDRAEQSLSMGLPAKQPDAIAQRDGQYEEQDLIDQVRCQALLCHVSAQHQHILSRGGGQGGFHCLANVAGQETDIRPGRLCRWLVGKDKLGT